MTDYNNSLDRTASQIREELSSKIREAIAGNQEVMIAHWIKQNPEADLSKIMLCHGFKGNYYTFWVEHKEEQPVYTGTGSDYLDCVLGVGGFESFGPITGED